MMFFLGENFSLFVVYITQQSLRSDRSACEPQPPGGNQESNGWTCPPKKNGDKSRGLEKFPLWNAFVASETSHVLRFFKKQDYLKYHSI